MQRKIFLLRKDVDVDRETCERMEKEEDEKGSSQEPGARRREAATEYNVGYILLGK